MPPQLPLYSEAEFATFLSVGYCPGRTGRRSESVRELRGPWNPLMGVGAFCFALYGGRKWQ